MKLKVESKNSMEKSSNIIDYSSFYNYFPILFDSNKIYFYKRSFFKSKYLDI